MTFCVYASEPVVESPSLCMSALLCMCALFWLSHKQLMRFILYGHLLETCEELDDIEMLNIVYA